MYKFVSLEHSTRPEKKWMATFQNTETNRKKVIHFGLEGADDYTIAHDKEQRERYRTRHARDLTTAASQTGMSPGALSYWVLWGNSTSIRTNLASYKRRFGL
jgi:hypothetical protein